MAASVRLDDVAFSDLRIEMLGDLAGYNRFEALGRLAHLWRICTQRSLYVISDVQVAACLGPKGVEAILAAELGERVEGGIRIKGTQGRIEWLMNLKANASAGGRAAKERRLALQTSARGVPDGVPSGTLEDSGECQKARLEHASGVPDACLPIPIPIPPLLKEEKKPLARVASETRPPKTAATIPQTLDTTEFAAAWSDWIADRAERRKPLTERAGRDGLKKLEAMGVDRAIACIHHSIAGGYQGLFEETGPQGSRAKPNPARVECNLPPFDPFQNAPGSDEAFAALMARNAIGPPQVPAVTAAEEMARIKDLLARKDAA